MYKVALSGLAEKDLKRISKQYKPHIFAALLSFRKSPYQSKKLKGRFKDYYSLRIGQYRIIYRVYKSDSSVFIIRIGPRQSVYK